MLVFGLNMWIFWFNVIFFFSFFPLWKSHNLSVCDVWLCTLISIIPWCTVCFLRWSFRKLFKYYICLWTWQFTTFLSLFISPLCDMCVCVRVCAFPMFWLSIFTLWTQFWVNKLKLLNFAVFHYFQSLISVACLTLAVSFTLSDFNLCIQQETWEVQVLKYLCVIYVACSFQKLENKLSHPLPVLL